MMVALARAGSTLFWSLPDTGPTTMQKAAAAAPSQSAAIVAMMAAALTCAVAAGPISAYTAATAAQLQAPQGYIGAVLGAQAAPPAWDIRREMRERGEAK